MAAKATVKMGGVDKLTTVGMATDTLNTAIKWSVETKAKYGNCHSYCGESRVEAGEIDFNQCWICRQILAKLVISRWFLGLFLNLGIQPHQGEVLCA